MSQQELLKRLVDTLADLHVEYMLTGSVVSSMQGEPRSSHDIDVVVDIERDAALRIARAFPQPDYYVDESAIRAAVEARDMFNLIDVRGGDKVDFWILKDEPFDRSCFDRRRTVEGLGMPLVVSSPEDTILGKLRWAKRSGGARRQFNDALRVYEVQYGRLDQEYLDAWADRVGVEEDLRRLRSEAEPIE